jgi:prepilin-type N-terminal cleavage/methylation domain-containing protein
MNRGSWAVAREERGFTLVEIVVALAVLALIAGLIAVLVLIAVRGFGPRHRARDLYPYPIAVAGRVSSLP